MYMYVYTDYIGVETDKGSTWQPSDVGRKLI